MNGSGSSRPLDRGNIGPSGVTARVKCSSCQVTKSLGQYGIGETECARCTRKPKGWRRGDLTIIGDFK